MINRCGLSLAPSDGATLARRVCNCGHREPPQCWPGWPSAFGVIDNSQMICA